MKCLEGVCWNVEVGSEDCCLYCECKSKCKFVCGFLKDNDFDESTLDKCGSFNSSNKVSE